MSLQGAASMAVLAETMRDLVGGKRLARIEIAYKAGVPVPAWVRCTGRVTALRGAEIDTEAAIVDPATWTPLVTAKATWDSQRTRGIRESVPEHIAAVVSRGHKSPALIEAVGRLVAQPTFGGNGMDNMRHWKHTVFAGPCDVYCEVDRETLPIALYLMADTSACFNGWADAQHHMVFTGTLSFEFEPVVISSGWVHFVSRRIKDESRKMAVEFEAETGCGVRLGRGQGVMVKVGRLKL
ncbi:hypothetical protein DFJ74DRAFT_682047 [Hyaloraphidium curvatum]|nr:hypothetical protein DFJ74DRAFT_682047 [Hyaloraphidium curvatum]